jgi:aminopeptidase 2
VPLSILTTDPLGHVSIDRTAILEEREKHIALDTSTTFKLNAGTVGVCGYLIFTHVYVYNYHLDRVLYSPERLAKIAAEASKENSIFTLDDRMGILYDTMALSKAGLAKLSDTLTVIDLWSAEKECKLTLSLVSLQDLKAATDLVLSSISDTLGSLVSTFSESLGTIEVLRAFIRVRNLAFSWSQRLILCSPCSFR